MNSFLSGCIGAGSLALVYGFFLAGRNTWRLLKELVTASKQVAKLTEVVSEFLQTANTIAAALQALHATLGVAPTQGQIENPPLTEGKRSPIFYPGPPPFTPVQYEATEEETEVVETTDKELVELEQAEEIRDKGFTVEPDHSIVEQPAGVTKDAE